MCAGMVKDRKQKEFNCCTSWFPHRQEKAMEIRHYISDQLSDATHKMQKEHKTKTRNTDVLDALRQDGGAIPSYRCT